MTLPELLRAAVLPLGLFGLSGPDACSSHPEEAEGAEPASAPCVPNACDPLCVEPGRYRVTEEVVEDGANGGRLWQRHATEPLPWDEAMSYCDAAAIGGLRGWRLPTPNELQSIRYKPGGLFGEARTRHYCIPSIDQAAFPDTPPDFFWTSRRMPDDTAWYVGFDDGRTHRDTRSTPHWVRCTHDPR